MSGEPQDRHGWEREGLRRLVEVYLWERFRSRETAQVTELADSVPVRRTHLTAVFREYLSDSPKRLMHEYQVIEAKRLLTHYAYSIEEVAHRAGFGSALAFHRAFVRFVGVSPRDYRAKNRTN